MAQPPAQPSHGFTDSDRELRGCTLSEISILTIEILAIVNPAMPTTSSNIKHVTMTKKIRVELCQRKLAEPTLSQGDLKQWLKQTHGLDISQSCISKTLKRSCYILGAINANNLSSKRNKTVKYPLMEEALIEWFRTYQDRVNMSGDLLKEKGAVFLKQIYPEQDRFEFSNGWLESFKKRYEIRSFRRFGESGSVNMARVAEELPKLREVLNCFPWKDIYNMDETGLFYRMQVCSGKKNLVIAQLCIIGR